MYNILCGTKDNNITFSDLQKILTLLGFVVRIKGDHFIYTKDDVDEIINILHKNISLENEVVQVTFIEGKRLKDYAKKIERRQKRANLTDFDRFKVMRLRQKRSAIKGKILKAKK